MISRLVGMFRRDPQLGVVLFVGVVIAYLSLSPTLMLFYGSFRSKPLGVPGEFTLAHYISAYSDPLDLSAVVQFLYFRRRLGRCWPPALAATLAWISIRTNAPFRKFFRD